MGERRQRDRTPYWADGAALATDSSVTASAPSIVEERRNEPDEEEDSEEGEEDEEDEEGRGSRENCSVDVDEERGGEERAASTSPQQTATYFLCTALCSK